MNTVLLTWNPGPFDEDQWTPEEWEDALVAPYLAGTRTATTWSVGNHINNIEPGDTAYLYRQGDWGRGIVARGTIRSHPFEGPHWAEGRENETTNYVEVEWREAVPVQLAFDVETLEAILPAFEWRKVYASGRQLPAGGPKLESAWQRYVNDPATRAYTELYLSDVWRNVVQIELDAL